MCVCVGKAEPLLRVCVRVLLCAQGLAAQDTFYVTYRGKALEKPMARARTHLCTHLCTRTHALVHALMHAHARMWLTHPHPHPLSCVCPQNELVSNALQYYLTMAELEKDESY